MLLAGIWQPGPWRGGNLPAYRERELQLQGCGREGVLLLLGSGRRASLHPTPHPGSSCPPWGKPHLPPFVGPRKGHRSPQVAQITVWSQKAPKAGAQRSARTHRNHFHRTPSAGAWLLRAEMDAAPLPLCSLQRERQEQQCGRSGHFSSESVARGEKSCAQPGNLHKRTAICFPSPAFVPRSPRPAAAAQTLRGNENESSRSAFPPAAIRRRRSGSCTSTAVPRTRMRAQEPSALMGALPAPAGPEQSLDISVRRKGSAPSPRSQCCSIPPMAEKCASQRAGGKTSAHPAAIGVH